MLNERSEGLTVNKLKQYYRRNSSVIGVYLLLIALIVFFNGFIRLTPMHLLDLFRQAAPLGIASIGQTLTMLMGGIDLSMGAVVSLTNIVACSLMLGNVQNIGFTLLIVVLISFLIGGINGLAISKVKIPPFLATLAISIIIKGVSFVYTKGSPMGSIAQEFRFISEGWVGFIPISGIIWIIIWVIMGVFLFKTTTGLKFYSTGGNPQASRLSGINTSRYTVLAYVLSSLLAAVAGLMISAYIGVTSSNVGDPYTLNTIAAACIGGTTFLGGRGSINGTFAGVMVIFIIQAFMTMMNIPEAGKQLSLGIIIVVMVALNQRMSFTK